MATSQDYQSPKRKSYPTMSQPPIKRFMRKTKRVGDCLVWIGYLNPKNGYANFNPTTRHVAWGMAAHRWIYEQKHGLIPAGMFVLHKCDNPACVSIDHLYLGTHADNMKDRTRRGRSARGETNGCARLTETAVIEIRWLSSQGSSGRAIAQQFGVALYTVQKIINRKTWRHV